jgi:GNAT superfamily N-acetyltransferase
MVAREPDVRIRPATPDDAEAIARLNGQLGYPSTAAQVRARFAALDRGPVWMLALAEVDAAIVGYVTCRGVYTIQRDPCAELGGLIVDERYRGRRIGELLVAAAEAWARENGFPAIIVHSNVVRTDAHRFYQRLGYSTVKAQQYFRKEIG